MQLVVDQLQNKPTAPNILWSKSFLFILLLFGIILHTTTVTAQLTCHQCEGINCLRTSFEATQKCLNDFDICVNVFDGQNLLAQGCWEQLPEKFRIKCGSGVQTHNSTELSDCFKCNENFCNDLSSSSFECMQCDSNKDTNCRTNPLNLVPTRCGISRTPNDYCFVKQEGEHVIRGCSYNLAEQMSCLNSENCVICQPTEISACNNMDITTQESSSGGEHTEDNGSENDILVTNVRMCNQCSGINCLRTSYNAVQKCINNLDLCATVFEDQTILAQGCWEQLPEEERSKCDNNSNCLKCSENLCNNFGSSLFECLQCDSNIYSNCRTNPLLLVPSRCGISRTPNEYCFIKQEEERVVRGCSYTLEEQMLCLSSDKCMICQPSEINSCNNIMVVKDDGGFDGVSNGGNTSNNGSSNGIESNVTDSGSSDEGNTQGGLSGGSDSGCSGGNACIDGSDDGVSTGNNDQDNDAGDGGSEDGSNDCSTCILNTFVLIYTTIVFLAK